jgi:hypothetical protein
MLELLGAAADGCFKHLLGYAYLSGMYCINVPTWFQECPSAFGMTWSCCATAACTSSSVRGLGEGQAAAMTYCKFGNMTTAGQDHAVTCMMGIRIR